MESPGERIDHYIYQLLRSSETPAERPAFAGKYVRASVAGHDQDVAQVVYSNLPYEQGARGEAIYQRDADAPLVYIFSVALWLAPETDESAVRREFEEKSVAILSWDVVSQLSPAQAPVAPKWTPGEGEVREKGRLREAIKGLADNMRDSSGAPLARPADESLSS